MDVRFAPHNTRIEDPSVFSDRDPHLRPLRQQVWVHRSSLLELLPVREPGICTLGGGRQIGKTTPTYSIEGAGEEDIAYVHRNRFYPIEVKRFAGKRDSVSTTFRQDSQRVNP